MKNKVFGPVRNNYGSLASTYLGTERVGFVDHGRRFVYDHRKLTAIDGERALKKLERVEAIAGGLGGGFAFSGPNGVFFAETFEGPLRSLSTETGPFELAPFAIVMMPAGAVIATRTGAVVASAPKDIERVFTHRDGFTIVRSQTTAWLSTDSQKWRELRIGEVRDAAPDGEALLVATDRGSVRVKREGSVAPAGLTDDEASARITMSHLAVDEYLAADQGFEGA